MATRKDIKEHLEKALKEIGKIQPRFDKEIDEWVFSHPKYPVEYGGESPDEVIKNYPKYLREFISHRLDDKLSPHTESKTIGHGGKRAGAGRPQGTTKEKTSRIVLPADIAFWFKNNPNALELARETIRLHRSA